MGGFSWNKVKHLAVIGKESNVAEMMRPVLESLVAGCEGSASDCAVCGRLPDHVDTEKGDPWPDAAQNFCDRIWIGECCGGLLHKVQQCPQCSRLYLSYEAIPPQCSDWDHSITLARVDVEGVLEALSGRRATVLIERTDGIWVVSEDRLCDYLTASIYVGDLESTRLWLDAGARCDARVDDTSLITAVRGGHAKIVELLLARGVDPAIKNKHGKSALDYARAAGRSDLCEMLVRSGGELGDWRQELENKAWKNNWPAAKQKAEEVLRIFPDNVDALFYYGVGCGASGDLVSAEKCLSRVVKKRPKHYDAWYNLGILALKSNDASRAVECLERADSLSPDNHAVLYKLGEAREKTGDAPSAIAAYEAAVRTGPDPWGGVMNYTDAAKKALRRLRRPNEARRTQPKKRQP